MFSDSKKSCLLRYEQDMKKMNILIVKNNFGMVFCITDFEKCAKQLPINKMILIGELRTHFNV